MSTENKIQIDILVTGSLREEDFVKELFHNIIDVKSRNSVVCNILWSSTDTFDKIDSFLVKNDLKENVIICCDKEPTIKSKGHRHHQILQLTNGLNLVEDDKTWILKMRTDKLLLNVELMQAIIDKVSILEKDVDGKIGILEGHVFLPWYINDMVYIGQKKSLKKLLFNNDLADSISPALSTEQVFWSSLLENEEKKKNFYIKSSNFEAVNINSLQDQNITNNCNMIKVELFEYWTILENNFFTVLPMQFADEYKLDINNITIKDNYLFSRYDKWGVSFTNLDSIKSFLKVL